jgi:hypothetical protein
MVTGQLSAREASDLLVSLEQFEARLVEQLRARKVPEYAAGVIAGAVMRLTFEASKEMIERVPPLLEDAGEPRT